MDFDDEPHAPTREGDPQTSHDAADTVQNIRAKQQMIFDLLEYHGPMIDEEIYREPMITIMNRPSGARTRRKELVDLGLVRDSGKRRPTEAGRQSTVWEAITTRRVVAEKVYATGVQTLWRDREKWIGARYYVSIRNRSYHSTVEIPLNKVSNWYRTLKGLK